MTESNQRVVIVTVVAILALAVGSYSAYRFGYDESHRSLEPELLKQIQANANITAENNALHEALVNASSLGVVKIGYLPATPSDMELSFISEVVQPDLNSYAAKLGYNVTFQFDSVDVVESSAPEHLRKIQELHKKGVDLVISGGWSSMLSAIRAYATDNHMLVVGTSSTSPWGLPIPGDRLFRINPPDSVAAEALVDIMWSYGVKSVILIQRGDSWGDGAAELFSSTWSSKGGVLAGDPIRYGAEEANFTSTLEEANRLAESAKVAYPEAGRVGILLLAFDEDVKIVSAISGYESLYSCVLFSANSHVGLKTDGFIDNAAASHLKVFAPAQRPFQSSNYQALKARYPGLDEQDAYVYDGAWAIAASVLEARSNNASDVVRVFPEVCGRLYGASGWCVLDVNGDREGLPMDIWFYSDGSMRSAGVYDPDSGVVTWIIE